MAQFKQPGFKTRIMQQHAARDVLQREIPALAKRLGMRPEFPNTAECMKPLPPMKARLTDFLYGELKDMAVNPCREMNLASDPFEQRGHKARNEVGPKKARAVNKWEEFDTHKPKGFYSPFRSPERYMERLKKHGFRCIGSGAYSAVFAKGDSKRVIKVCRRADTDAYPMFADWAHKHPSPYLPVIHSFKRHERKGAEGFYVVVLDRFKKTVDSTDHRLGWQDATRIIWGYARREDERPSAIRDSIRQGVWDGLPGMKDMIDAFRAEFNGLAHFDMHDGNWMVTDKGQLIMIDPLSGATSDAATKRNKRVSRIKASLRAAA